MYLKPLLLIFLSSVVLISFLPLRFSFRYTKHGNDEDGLVSFWLCKGLEYNVRFLSVRGDNLNLKELIEEEHYNMEPEDILDVYHRLKKVLNRYQIVSNFLLHFFQGTWPESDLLEGHGHHLGKLALRVIDISGRRCELFEWRSRLGLEDAATTAIGVGILWNIKVFILKKITDYVIFLDAPPKIEVKPDFEHNTLDTSFHCIFQLKIGHIILDGLINVFRGLLSRGIKILQDAVSVF